MKTGLNPRRCSSAGHALLMVLAIVVVSMIVLGATINRTTTVARLNDRNNDYVTCLNAAEAAVEKVYARLSYDFQNFGLGSVTNNLAIYRAQIPNEHAYWSDFAFSDGQGNANRNNTLLWSGW